MQMSFKEMFNFFKEVEVIGKCEKNTYFTRYDMVLKKLITAGEKEYIDVKWVKEDENFVYFKVNEDYKDRCIELLKKVNNKKISQSTMNKITKIFYQRRDKCETPFWTLPRFVTNIRELAECLDESESEDPTVSALCFVEYYQKTKPELNLFNDEYWFYVDGSDLEAYAETQDEVIRYLIDCVKYFLNKKEKRELFETLKSITEGC